MKHRTVFFLSAALFGGVALVSAQSQSARKPALTISTAPDSAAVARGKELFKQQCAICHFDASAAKKVGPGLKGLSRRGNFADGKPITDDSLRLWIENGGKNMPAFKGMLSAEGIRDLVAYTKSL